MGGISRQAARADHSYACPLRVVAIGELGSLPALTYRALTPRQPPARRSPSVGSRMLDFLSGYFEITLLGLSEIMGPKMILSFGLHWHLDRVNWGKPGVLGELLGAASRSRNARAVDFRDQRGIYVLYAGYELVYIGQTGSSDDRLFKRLKYHKTDHLSERWDRFSWFGTQWVTKAGTLSADSAGVSENIITTLNILEAVSIAIAEPRLNLSRGKWGEATQYYQYKNREETEEEED